MLPDLCRAKSLLYLARWRAVFPPKSATKAISAPRSATPAERSLATSPPYPTRPIVDRRPPKRSSSLPPGALRPTKRNRSLTAEREALIADLQSQSARLERRQQALPDANEFKTRFWG